MKTTNPKENEENRWKIAFQNIALQVSTINEALLREERGEDKEPDFDEVDRTTKAESDREAVEEHDCGITSNGEGSCDNPMHGEYE